MKIINSNNSNAFCWFGGGDSYKGGGVEAQIGQDGMMGLGIKRLIAETGHGQEERGFRTDSAWNSRGFRGRRFGEYIYRVHPKIVLWNEWIM